MFLSAGTPQPVLNSLRVQSNLADAGGFAFIEGASAGDMPPACSGCSLPSSAAAVALNYGSWVASPPTSSSASAPLTAQSRQPLILSASVYDAYNQTVQSFTHDVVVTVTAQVLNSTVTTAASSNISSASIAYGSTAAVYAAGSAQLTALALAAPVGALVLVKIDVVTAFADSYAKPSPHDGGSSGLGGRRSLVLTIAQCGQSQRFDASALLCVCVPNAAADAGGECACQPTYYWDATVEACLPCPEGAMCQGGLILSLEGWWRAKSSDSRTYACKPGRCLSEVDRYLEVMTSKAAPRKLQESSPELDGHVCGEGREGPLCAICSQGFALQARALLHGRNRVVWT